MHSCIPSFKYWLGEVNNALVVYQSLLLKLMQQKRVSKQIFFLWKSETDPKAIAILQCGTNCAQFILALWQFEA